MNPFGEITKHGDANTTLDPALIKQTTLLGELTEEGGAAATTPTINPDGLPAVNPAPLSKVDASEGEGEHGEG